MGSKYISLYNDMSMETRYSWKDYYTSIKWKENSRNSFRNQTDGFILTGGLRMLGSRFPPQLQDRLKRFIIHTG